jgi:hypothetical protein
MKSNSRLTLLPICAFGTLAKGQDRRDWQFRVSSKPGIGFAFR